MSHPDVEAAIAKARATDDVRPRFWMHLTQAELYGLLAGFVAESVKLQAFELTDERDAEKLFVNVLKPHARTAKAHRRKGTGRRAEPTRGVNNRDGDGFSTTGGRSPSAGATRSSSRSRAAPRARSIFGRSPSIHPGTKTAGVLAPTSTATSPVACS